MHDVTQRALSWPVQRSEMADRIRAHDWSATPLGPPEAWPQSLRTAVDLILDMPGPANILWGPDHVQIYNDAYIPIARDRHPGLLGRPVREGWPEVFDSLLAPRLAAVFTGRATEDDEMVAILQGPEGELEERSFETTFSPIRDGRGEVAGALEILVEVTQRSRARAALVESEELRRIALESGGMGAWRWDTRTGLVRADAAFQELWGLAPVDQLHPYSTYADLMFAEGAAALEAVMSKKAGPGEIFDDQVCVAKGPKSGRWIQWRGRAEPDRPWIINGVSFDITSERLAEQQLLDSEARLRKILDIETVGVVFFDLVGEIRDANQAFLSTIGYSRSDLEAGRVRYAELTPADWHWRDERTIAELRATGSVAPFEKQYQRKDGSRIWVLCAGRMLDDEIAVEFIIDVTEHRLAEAARRESEERLAAIFASAPVGLSEIGLDGGFLRVNDELCRILGRSREELLRSSVQEVTHPDDLQLSLDAAGRTIATGQPIALDKRYTRGDGSEVWASSTLSVVRDPDGRPSRLLAVTADLTDRRKAEAALRESEERTRAILESAMDYAIFTLDSEGRIETWSPGAEAVFGWTAEEAIGQPAEMTFVEEDRARGVPERERQEAREKGLAPNVRWHLRKDGSRVFIEGSTRPIVAWSSERQGFLKIGQDVTRRKRDEERQATLLAELQHRVRNVLAMIRSVARRTAATSETVEDYDQHLEGRISAMARTQALLTRAPGVGVDLQNVLLDELLAQAAAQDQVRVEGPDIQLAPKAAEVLTLAIHELATNATKYGALSTRGGRIDISWSAEDRGGQSWLVLKWREQGVEIGDPPARRGFGTELVLRRVPYELRGRGDLDFTPHGLVATIEFPLLPGESILQSDGGRLAQSGERG